MQGSKRAQGSADLSRLVLGHINNMCGEISVYSHVNITVHDRGGHFIPWEIPDGWIDDVRYTFRHHR